MLHWRTLVFLLLIALQDTIVHSQPTSNSDSDKTKDVNPSSTTTVSSAFPGSPLGNQPFVPKPASGLGSNSMNGPNTMNGPNSMNGPNTMNGPKPFNINNPQIQNMPLLPPLPPGCKTITGTWYNEVGSRLVINQGPDGTLTGTYYTLRQSGTGDKKPLKANVVGGAAFIANTVMTGFTVNWGDNGYTTVWAGQCYLCGKDEIIETNWLMREPVKECIDKWHANRFGHSTFKKTKPDLPDEDIADKDDVPAVPPMKKSESKDGNDTCSTMDGVWFNELGAKLDLEVKDNGTMEGVYELPAIIKMAKSAKVSGISFYKEGDTFGFGSINEDGRVVTVWVGQCQKCKNNNTDMVMLDTYVANRLWVQSCLEEFRTTAYGANKFTRDNFAPQMFPMHPGSMEHAGPLNHEGGSMMNKPPKEMSNSDMDYPLENPKLKPLPGMTDNNTTTSSNIDKITTKAPVSSDN